MGFLKFQFCQVKNLANAQGHQETKVIFLKNFLSSFFPTSRSKIRRFSDFSTHLYILYMCAKIRKLKVATQNLALKMRNRESYFLRKLNFFQKPKKIKTVFFLPTSHYHLTLRSVRKNISKNFPNQFYTSFPKFEPIFKFCLGQR